MGNLIRPFAALTLVWVLAGIGAFLPTHCHADLLITITDVPDDPNFSLDTVRAEFFGTGTIPFSTTDLTAVGAPAMNLLFGLAAPRDFSDFPDSGVLASLQLGGEPVQGISFESSSTTIFSGFPAPQNVLNIFFENDAPAGSSISDLNGVYFLENNAGNAATFSPGTYQLDSPSIGNVTIVVVPEPANTLLLITLLGSVIYRRRR